MDEHYAVITNELSESIERVRPNRSTCCIYRVPAGLRSVNQEAYTPIAVSIGPLHHGENRSLKMMEEAKLGLLKYFIKRTGRDLSELVNIVKEKENRLRDYYHGSFELENNYFGKVILVDAVFVVELFLTKYSQYLQLPVEGEHLLNVELLFKGVGRDLLLLENQVPFFILEDFWKCATQKEIKDVLYRHFNSQGEYCLKAEGELHRLSTPKHLVDLLRNLYVPLEPKPTGKAKAFRVPSVTDLQLAGVELTVMESRESLCDVRFSRGTLKIPKLRISDSTEIVFRNLIAFEQCHCPVDRYYICHYVRLMDFLIDTSEDVDLLVGKKIVENWMGNSNHVSDMINRLGFGVYISEKDFCFAEILDGLNSHCEIPCNKWMANLKQKYFNTPWAFISFCAAAFLLILSIIQAVCAIIPLIPLIKKI